MKAITVVSVSAEAGGGGASVALTEGQFAIVCTAATTVLTQPEKQVTVIERSTVNTAWSRSMRLTNEALVGSRYGSTSLALLLPSFGKICVAVEPTLTWPVVVSTQPTAPATFVANGTNSRTVTIAITANELPSTYQWQMSASNTDVWTSPTDLTESAYYIGVATASMEIKPANADNSKNGYYVRCKVVNAKGTVYSNSVVLAITAA